MAEPRKLSPEEFRTMQLLELDLLEQPTNTRAKAVNTASNLNSLFIKNISSFIS